MAVITPIFVGQHYLLTISFEFSALTAGLWPGLIFLEKQILVMAPLAAGVFFLLAYAHVDQQDSPNYKTSMNFRWSLSLLFEIVGFVALLRFIPRVFTFFQHEGHVPTGLTFTFLLLSFMVFFLALRSLYTLSAWRRLLVYYRWPLLTALAISLPVAWLAHFSQSLWIPFLVKGTFYLSNKLLSLLYIDIIYEPEQVRLGTHLFTARIFALCSGYEGIGLVSGFTALYLWLFRGELRFPNALILMPIGIAVVWLGNVLRIVALIVIGTEISPEIAMGGFHSNSGLIFFVLVSLLVLLLGHSSSWITRRSRPRESTGHALSAPMLVPFILLTATTLATPAFSADFDWLYPLRVLFVGVAVAWFWSQYGFSRKQTSWWGFAAGIAGFLIWLALIPQATVENSAFRQSLDSVPVHIAIVWLLFRVIGSVVTVPIAEELLFRGYMLSRLCQKPETALRGRLGVKFFPILVTSILFGVLHHAWVAGTVVGLMFALVRIKSGYVMDAIVAHAVTNGLLTIYVLTTQNWAYW